jgi:hypothetical protein
MHRDQPRPATGTRTRSAVKAEPDSGATDARVLHALAWLGGNNDITFGVCLTSFPGRIRVGDLVAGPGSLTD